MYATETAFVTEPVLGRWNPGISQTEVNVIFDWGILFQRLVTLREVLVCIVLTTLEHCAPGPSCQHKGADYGDTYIQDIVARNLHRFVCTKNESREGLGLSDPSGYLIWLYTH